VAVARGLGASEHQVENIRIAARLHELGIVCLPEDEDKEVFRYEQGVRDQSRHPLIGEMLLKGLPGFEMVADILRHLHENVDGTGIPDRLSGERIPLGSRIVSAASYFDHRLMVMEEMKPHDVLALMERKGGSLFDEKVLGMLRDYVGGHDRYEKQNAYECTVFALQEGMELASDIYSESGINLLRHGTVLTKDMLTRVQKFHNVDPIIGMVRVKAK
jgi:HD-GYP domain-containing protein (c-di-GMP phosphodiesterase class II)